MIPDKIERGLTTGQREKNSYRTCCTVCHVKCGTVFLGIVEGVVCIFVLLAVLHQIYWKHQSIDGCTNYSNYFFRDCLIFQFTHFNITLILDYIVIVMCTCILFSIFMMLCGILTDTSCLVLPHLVVQGFFLLFSLGYFCFYAWSYFYGDLYTHSRPFMVQSLIERMWLAALVLILAAFQTYLFTAVVRCSMYLAVIPLRFIEIGIIQTIEERRRERAAAFDRCTERVRTAKQNGLWRTTSWGGGFQQYKGQYDDKKPKKSKGFRVKWNFNQNVVVEDEEVPIMQREDSRTDSKSSPDKSSRSESPKHHHHSHPQEVQVIADVSVGLGHQKRTTEMRVRSESERKDKPKHNSISKTSSEGSSAAPIFIEHPRKSIDHGTEQPLKHVEHHKHASNRENREPNHSGSISPKREHIYRSRNNEQEPSIVVFKPHNKHLQRPPLKSNQSVESADSIVISSSSQTPKHRHHHRHSIDIDESPFHSTKKRHEVNLVKKVSITSTHNAAMV